MTHCVSSRPTARVPHGCFLCCRTIQPGEVYQRQAILDRAAWTLVHCEHCARVILAYCCETQRDEGYELDVIEWLGDTRPSWFAAMRAWWRYPDGELMAPVAMEAAS